MVIGTCTIELHIPGNGSLKGKRQVIKSIIARVHNEFNVSIAEVAIRTSGSRPPWGWPASPQNGGSRCQSQPPEPGL
jgi:hypothetical protein